MLNALAGTFAVRFDPPAMQPDHALDQRQPESQSALSPVRGALALGEQVEDVRQQARFDAAAVVADAQAHFVTLHVQHDFDLPALRRIFGGVGEQVDDHLHQARLVGVHVRGFAAEAETERMAPRFDAGACLFDRAGHHLDGA